MSSSFVTGIAHLALNARDVKKSLDFYCGALGLKHSFSIPREDGAPWIEYVKVTDGQFIELFYPEDESGFVTGKTSFMHICLSTHDIFAAEKAMIAAGVPIDIHPMQGKDNNWQMWVKDPDGNKIEFMQIDSNSPQANA